MCAKRELQQAEITAGTSSEERIIVSGRSGNAVHVTIKCGACGGSCRGHYVMIDGVRTLTEPWDAQELDIDSPSA